MEICRTEEDELAEKMQSVDGIPEIWGFERLEERVIRLLLRSRTLDGLNPSGTEMSGEMEINSSDPSLMTLPKKEQSRRNVRFEER